MISGTEIPSTLCVCGATVTILRRYTCKIYLLSNRQLRCENSHQFCATKIKTTKTAVLIFGGGTEIPSTLCVCGETVTISRHYHL